MRNLGLDLLRAVAVLLVIVRHLEILESAFVGFKMIKQGGWVGVDLFFVLSGFLVSSLLFKEFTRFGKIDVKRFLIRRAFKIYPAFWLFLACSLLLKYSNGRFPSTTQIFAELLFVQNYLGGIWEHTWSLAVEEHFYLGIALLFTCLVAWRPQQPFAMMPGIFFVVAGTCLSFRVLNLILVPEYSHQQFMFGSHLRVDSLMFGVLLAYLANFYDLERRVARIASLNLVAAGMSMLLPAFLFALESNKWVSVFGVILFYCGSGLCLLAALRLKSSASAYLQLLGAIGAASYSIYLWHIPVALQGFILLTKFTGVESYNLYLLNAVVGACAFGWIMSRLIEQPVLVLRNWLFPTSVGAVTTTERSVEPSNAKNLTVAATTAGNSLNPATQVVTS